jgi:CheY-specific phosphatase CheX
MKKMKTIKLPCYGITIKDHGEGVAEITDDLHEEVYPEALDNGCGIAMASESWNNLVDGITSLVLAHYSAGIDVTTPTYIEGIETAVQACEQYAED